MTEVVFPLKGKRVWVAGHRGMVGSALVRRLAAEDCEILTIGREQVDLRRQADTEAWVEKHRPDAVFLAAATVGGVHANNTRPAEFLYDNLAIATNVVEAARRSKVQKLMFLGSTCINPREAAIPTPEDVLLTGPLEPTNEWYAVAKIAGIKLCHAYRRQWGCDFVACMPTNLYGPGDNFHPQHSHVIPGMINKFTTARDTKAEQVEIWGTGNAIREFLYVDDCADGVVFLMKHYSGESIVNIGTGRETSVRELAETVSKVVGYQGRLHFDTTKPEGAPRRLLDSAMINGMGWRAPTTLEAGLRATYDWFTTNEARRV